MKKKKIYLIDLPDDGGELWLDENKKPLSWIHCNDATWRDEYQNFIIKYLDGELIQTGLKTLPESVSDALSEADCVEKIYSIVKKYIK